MADQLHGIITQLEQRKAAIERALEVLRNVDGAGETASASSATGPAKRTGGMTPAGRRRLSAALKKRWAAKKAAEAAAHTRSQKPARRKVRFTPEGRQRLAEAMKRRWAAKRTAAQAKKRGRKAA